MLLTIAAIAIVIISYGTYSYPTTAINSLSPTPLGFVNPLPTVVILRLFAYRGPCITQRVTTSSFRMLNSGLYFAVSRVILCWILGYTFLDSGLYFDVFQFILFLSAQFLVGMIGTMELVSHADTISSQCTGTLIIIGIWYPYYLVDLILCVYCFNCIFQSHSPAPVVKSLRMQLCNLKLEAWLKRFN